MAMSTAVNPEAVLAEAVAWEVRRGAKVINSASRLVTLEYGAPPNHLLHLLLTVFTCGLWAPIWLLLGIMNHAERRNLTVDDMGQLWWA